MKAYSPLAYGFPETLKLQRRARSDARLQEIFEYINSQIQHLRKNTRLKHSDRHTSTVLPGYVKIGLHNHFPKGSEWYSPALKAFNPDKLEEFARQANLHGFSVVTVSNYYDDQLFGHEPGVVFDFNGERVIVLKSQERHHVQPFGYDGRMRNGTIDNIVNSALDQKGLVLFCHPSNLAYNGVGEAVIEKFRDSTILETQSPLANHPSLLFQFADIIAKEWSLKYRVPGVSNLDSHNLYFYGGFFAPQELIDLSSPRNLMESLRLIFQLRREELQTSPSLNSRYIVNTEEYPSVSQALIHEGLPATGVALRNEARKFFFRTFGLHDRNKGLSSFDYRGKDTRGNHVYLLKGQNPAEEFSVSQPQNLVFYSKGGKIHIGSSFTDIQACKDADLESVLNSFSPAQAEFFRDMISHPAFQEFKTGLHPVYPIACAAPNGQIYVFVAKEFLTEYLKGDWVQIPFFRWYNVAILRGTESLMLASIQSSLIGEGVNAIPPLYVEFSQGKGRIISPYYRLESISADYSAATKDERRRILDRAADHLAMIKSRGFYLPDMHLGNIANEKGNWFEETDSRPIVPDVNVAGSSLISFGDSRFNLVNPLSLLFSPRASFITKAVSSKHKLIQSPGDVVYFLGKYRQRLEQYKTHLI